MSLPPYITIGIILALQSIEKFDANFPGRNAVIVHSHLPSSRLLLFGNISFCNLLLGNNIVLLYLICFQENGEAVILLPSKKLTELGLIEKVCKIDVLLLECVLQICSGCCNLETIM